jgi:membrane protease YdiL (CAAX protease family)
MLALDRLIVPVVLAIVAAANAIAFSPRFIGQPHFVWVLVVPYLLLAAVALYRMDRDGTMLDLFRARQGDVTLGVGSALGIGLGVFLARAQVLTPGTSADAWLLRLYLHIGKLPDHRGAYALVAVGFLLAALLEEVVWRGMVQQVLEERLGVRKGWLLTALLYAASYLPVMWMLRMPPAGLNPLLPAAALFCGTIWGFVAGRTQRLPPVLLSHALFAFAFGLQYRL